jgi:protein-disulfide isomerase
MKAVIIFSVFLLIFASCSYFSKDNVKRVNNDDFSVQNAHLLGDINASIEIVEYSDFECLYSKLFFNEILPSLKQEYILTNKAKLVFKYLPLNSVHPNAHKAAEAAECASQQGKFWEMHDSLFKKGVGGGVEDFKKYAAELNLSTEKFDTCLDSNSTRKAVIDDYYSGINSGVKGTPTFIINGNIAPTLKNYNEFKEYLESLEKK